MKELRLLTVEKRMDITAGREDEERGTIEEGGNRCYKQSMLGKEEVTGCFLYIAEIESVQSSI